MLTQLAAELNKYMPEKVLEDVGNSIMSPMPGTIVSIDIAVGDEVSGIAMFAAITFFVMYLKLNHTEPSYLSLHNFRVLILYEFIFGMKSSLILEF